MIKPFLKTRFNRFYLRQEVLSPDFTLTPSTVDRLRYIRSSYRETSRLFPVVSIMMRQLGEELEVGGYRVPAATNFMWSNDMMGRDPRHFDEPDR